MIIKIKKNDKRIKAQHAGIIQTMISKRAPKDKKIKAGI